MARRWAGVLRNRCSPKFIVATSRVQISGRSADTCRVRVSGDMKVVPGPATDGSGSPGTNRPPAPVVRLRITDAFRSRIRSTTSR